MLTSRLATILAALCLGTFAWSQCDLKVVSIEPCDAKGKPAAWTLGDPVYGVRVDWAVRGTARPYNVKFEMANRSWVWKNVDAAGPGDHFWGFATFDMPLDGPIPVRVTLDPDGTSGDADPTNNVAQAVYTPTLPASAIEYYAPRRLKAWQGFSVSVPPESGADKLALYFGTPTTETFQKVLSDGGVAGFEPIRSAPFGYPCLRKTFSNPRPGSYDFEHSFEIEASSVRTNLAGPMARWSAYDALPSGVEPYLQPEKPVQSDDPAIAAFVKRSLPENYRSRLSPYETARTLFTAVARELTYETPYDVDAVKVLTTKKGDCGGMSALYVACLRHVGIPARLVCGWRKGKDVWHCWSETYVPGAGWAPQDVTDCNALAKDGSYAYCFSVVPDLNERVAVNRGGTFTTPDTTWSTLQPGQWGVWGSIAHWPTWTYHCTLDPENSGS